MKWWKNAAIYQIYPRSFNDSNGDGMGDIRGIIEKIDYLSSLGIDAIWFSPVFDSPQDDNGYDISDYKKIYPLFGTNDDMFELIELLHKHNIKVIMDLVVNHSSDEHPWFIESRKSKDNPYRDYYIWKDPVNGQEPNNWGSFFSGSAWEFDHQTGQYYLHYFSKRQPDLNWENPKVRTEVWDIMKYWMNKGVDGWRLDVITSISKDMSYPDYKSTLKKKYYIGKFHSNGPRLHEYLHEMYTEVLSHYDSVTVGEAPASDPENALLFTAPEREELDMIFTFEHMLLDTGDNDFNSKWNVKPLHLPDLKHSMAHWQQGLYNRGWNTLYFENHDQPRIISRWGNDTKYRVECAKMFAALMLFMHGTPFIYQGQEIGMTNCRMQLEEYNDLEVKNAYRELVEELKLMSKDDFMEALYYRARDNSRTPMQWDSTSNAGFTNGKPWLKVNPNFTKINVSDAEKDNTSVLTFYKQILALRKKLDVVINGTFELIEPESTELFAYKRELDNEKLYLYANFTDSELAVKIEYNDSVSILISNYSTKTVQDNQILRPFEVLVYTANV